MNVESTHLSVTEIFAECAKKHAARVAVRYLGEALTYAELDQKSDSFAAVLQQAGVAHGDYVGVFSEQRLELPIALLGILKAGAAYAPLDETQPPERLKFMAEDAGLRVVISSKPGNSGYAETTLGYDSGDTQLAQQLAPVSPDAVAALMYTSGTTGTPKGVMVPHRGIARLVKGADFMDFGVEQVWLQHTRVGFDTSYLEIWGPLLNGSEMVVLPEEELSFRSLDAAIKKYDVTATHYTAGLFHAIVDAAPENLSSLQQLVVSGDVISPERCKQVLQMAPDLALYNGYGPTENSALTTVHRIEMQDVNNGDSVPIGKPVTATDVFVVDEQLNLVAPGRTGELVCGGAGLALGYLNRPKITAEKFITAPWDSEISLYRIGDLGHLDNNGRYIFEGRIDTQVKIRGFRVELGEIESALEQHADIQQAIVLAKSKTDQTDKTLIAFFTVNGDAPNKKTLQRHLKPRLPEYALPAQFVAVESIPLNTNGKVDRRQLLSIFEKTDARSLDNDVSVGSGGAVNQRREIVSIVEKILEVDRPPLNVSFLDLGASSIEVAKIHELVQQRLEREFPVTDMFKHSSISKLSNHLADKEQSTEDATRFRATGGEDRIAIVGLSGRFPGADDVETFWQNLLDGKDTINRFSAEELELARAYGDDDYVAARGIIENALDFDAGHFGLPPREADIMDPQHRVMLECAQQALENAAHSPDKFSGHVGVFAGCSMNTYIYNNVFQDPASLKSFFSGLPLSNVSALIGNDKDYITTRVAHKLNLTGPAVNVQSACSTSLLAVATACDSLRSGQCDMALAGGVTISFPQRRDYMYIPGAITSVDGRCRPFSDEATGTVFGEGAGMVVLRRLDDAIADNDNIVAVICGYAVNNDGADKAGFTAPGVRGQVDVIRAAQRNAGITASEVGYIEAHGTGTPLGDPIEIAALTEAFAADQSKSSDCVLGSVKANVGHLETASGITGLIKTAFAVQHNKIPPLINYQRANEKIDFGETPFSPATETRAWSEGRKKRIAGVSSFGFGGTNVHVILEQPPVRAEPARHDEDQVRVLPLSASSAAALSAQQESIAEFLEKNPERNAGDVALTLQQGRQYYEYRTAVAGRTVTELVENLRKPVPQDKAEVIDELVLMFPGQGAQHVGMGQALYKKEPVFTSALDQCIGILRDRADIDLLAILYPHADHAEAMRDKLLNTAYAQPAIFSVSFALAKQWQAWGIQADHYIGHSIGEFVAATLAGVFSLQDVLELIALRGSLMADLPTGAMLSVRCSESEIRPFLSDGLDLAVVNGPELCVVAGAHEKIDALVKVLEDQSLSSSKLHTSHAFHSAMMAPAIEPFANKLHDMRLEAPQMNIVSTVTGQVMDAATAMSAEYWAEHIRRPVRFDDAVGFLQQQPNRLYLEVGPGTTLTTLARARAQLHGDDSSPALSSLPHVSHSADARNHLHQTFGRLWAAGYAVDWRQKIDPRDAHCRRINLPGYPFQRKRHWIEPSTKRSVPVVSAFEAQKDLPANAPEDQAALDDESDIGELFPVQKITLLLSGLSGYSPDQIIPDATFLELGFDSLLLTQACKELNQEFSLNLTLRQLIDEYSSVDSLAAYLSTAKPGKPKAQKLDEDIVLNVTSSESSAPLTRINVDQDSNLTEAQQQFIDELVGRYTQKTKTSKLKTAEHRPHYADPRTASGFNRLWKEMVYQIITVESQGSRLLDIDGNEYIDLLNGFGPGFLGHSPEFLIEALSEQLHQGFEVGPQSLMAMESAELFCKLTGVERASFVCTGSEAVQAVMRIARTVTGRDKIVVFSKDYHGNFDEVLVRSVNADGKLKSLPLAPGIPNRAVDDIIMLPYGTDESLKIIRENASQLAAVIVEPVQSRRPEFQPHEFIQAVREITGSSGSLFIFDEVITGLRLGPGGAQDLYGVEADLATYGKVIAGGMPIGVVAGKAEYMDTFDGGQWGYGDDSFPDKPVTFFAGTFVRHPLAMAGTKAMLEHLLQQPRIFWKKIDAKAEQICQPVDQLFRRHNIPMQMVNCGSIMFIRVLDNHQYASLLFYLLREKGIFILEGFPSYVTEALSQDEILYVVKAFTQSVNELLAVGFFGTQEGLDEVRLADTHMTPPAKLSLARELEKSGLPLPAPVVAEPTFYETDSSEAQKEIWLEMLINADAIRAYNESICLSFNGELQGEYLVSALVQTFGQHDSLRSTFNEDGTIVRIHDDMAFDIISHDLSELDNTALELQIAELKRLEVDTSFDLVNGPLARGHVIKKSDAQWEVIITTHHVVCDGWSIDMLVRDFADVYNTLISGEQKAITHPASIIDYIEKERRWQGSPAYEQAEAYWLDLFADEIPALELPLDKSRPAQKTSNGARLDFLLDPDLMAALKKTGAANGSTLVNTLLAALKLYIYRLTGQPDMAIALPSAGQAARGMKDLIGHCVNLLPLRSQLDPEKSFVEFLGELRSNMLDSFEHQFYGYGTLAKNLRSKRDPARVFLAPVSFNLDNGMDLGGINFSGVQPELGSLPRTYEHFEWFLNIVEDQDRYVMEWSYNTDLFEEASIVRHLENYKRLLADIVADPERRLSEYSLYSNDIFTLQQQRYEETIVDYPDLPLHQLIEQRAVQIADKTAMIVPATETKLEMRFTHGEINAQANQIARGLQTVGVNSGDLVGVCLPRNENLLPTIVAILKLGAAYLPLDPSLPPERVALMVADSGAKLVVAEQSLSDVIADSDASSYFIDTNRADLAQLSDQNLGIDVPVQDTAYIIYTSGSTGKPKGVCISHRAVVNMLSSIINQPGFTSSDRILALTTLSFDIAVLEMYLPLLVGGQLLLASREDAYEPQKLVTYIEQYDLTIMQATPSTYRMMIEYGWRGNQNLNIFCGGEAMTSDLVSQLLPTCKSLWNMYGPTEATVYTIIKKIESGQEKITIGQPIANTEALILDQNMRPVPVGVEGELYLGGDGLAIGYLNRPELDQERFVAHPFAYNAGKRLYRTGDLAKRVGDNEIECLGRVDDQVKVRGYRIETGEIEAALLNQPAVATAAVVCDESGTANARLLAWVVPASGAGYDEKILRHALLQTLPEYMVPSRIFEIDKIPLSGSGKLDKKSLPRVNNVVGTEFSESTPVEKKLLEIWSKVLRVSDIDVNANFFELGGHSLLAVRMFNRVKKEFGTELPIATLFENPTISSLAIKIVAEGPVAMTDVDGDWDTTTTIHKGGDGRALFIVGGIGGNVNNLFEFGQALGKHRPLIGLQTRGVMGHRAHSSIEAMATEHIRYMRLRQSRGPYLIAGYSGGGLTAFEIARQLEVMGEEVGFLSVIDTDAPNFRPPVHRYSRNPLVFLKQVLQRIKRDGLKVKIISLPRKILPERFFDWFESRGSEDLQRYMRLADEWRAVAEKYEGGSYQGDMTLFRSAPKNSDEDAISAYDPLLGWQSNIDGEISVVHSSVGHLEMVEDQQAIWLAEEMHKRILDCE